MMRFSSFLFLEKTTIARYEQDDQNEKCFSFFFSSSKTKTKTNKNKNKKKQKPTRNVT